MTAGVKAMSLMGASDIVHCPFNSAVSRRALRGDQAVVAVEVESVGIFHDAGDIAHEFGIVAGPTSAASGRELENNTAGYAAALWPVSTMGKSISVSATWLK